MASPSAYRSLDICIHPDCFLQSSAVTGQQSLKRGRFGDSPAQMGGSSSLSILSLKKPASPFLGEHAGPHVAFGGKEHY